MSWIEKEFSFKAKMSRFAGALCSNIYKLKFFVCNFICVCMYECVCVRACVRVRVRVCLSVSVCASGVHWHVHAHELCESSGRYPACQNAGERIFSENFSGFDWRASFGSLENPKCTTSIWRSRERERARERERENAPVCVCVCVRMCAWCVCVCLRMCVCVWSATCRQTENATPT